MNIKVSAIIPVYNAEQYIIECIYSLINQTLKECEFIFVNDGSTDRSKFLIENYLEKDKRIILINQGNQGVSSARNKGLEIAKGEYVEFVDADDFIEIDMFETLYKSAKQNDSDIVISNFESEIRGHKVITEYPFPVDTVFNKIQKEELLLYFVKSDSLNTACCKIYKNEVIQKYNVIFPERVALGEDGLFNIHFISKANTIKYIEYIGYHYREVQGSATRNIKKFDYFQRALEVYKAESADVFFNGIDKEKIKKFKVLKLINSVMSYIHVYFTPNKEMNLKERYRYIRNMVINKKVQEALPLYYREFYDSLGRYEKILIQLIRRKFILGLYFITTYSRLRNE